MKMISAVLIALALLSMAAPVYAFDSRAFWDQQERQSGEEEMAVASPKVAERINADRPDDEPTHNIRLWCEAHDGYTVSTRPRATFNTVPSISSDEKPRPASRAACAGARSSDRRGEPPAPRVVLA